MKERCAKNCLKDCDRGKRECQLMVPLIIAAIETPRRTEQTFAAIHKLGYQLSFPRNGGFFVEKRTED